MLKAPRYLWRFLLCWHSTESVMCCAASWLHIVRAPAPSGHVFIKPHNTLNLGTGWWLCFAVAISLRLLQGLQTAALGEAYVAESLVICCCLSEVLQSGCTALETTQTITRKIFLNHFEERLLDQAQLRTLYTPPFLGSFA